MNYSSHNDTNTTTSQIRRAGTIIKICLLAFGLQAILLSADTPSDNDADVTIQKARQDSDSTPKVVKPQEKVVIKPKAEEKKIKETWFINCNMNDVKLIITESKNKQFVIHIKAGAKYKCKHVAESLKKVVCHEHVTSHRLDTASITINQSDLNTYETFVFNSDQKVEKYKYKSIREKNIALKYARMTKNEKLFQEISDQPIYNP